MIAFVCAGVVLSCEQDIFVGLEIEHSGNTSPWQESGRDYNREARNVLLLYSAGYNSISSYLAEDIADLMKGDVPSSGRMNDILLIYSHQPASRGNYSVPTSPVLMRIYKGTDGTVVKDTLEVYPEGTCSASAVQLNKVLTYVNEHYSAKSYGMIFSSHATGYLPSGYYTAPYSYKYQDKSGMMYRGGYREFYSQPVPYCEPQYDPSLPAVKSIGQDQVGTPGNYHSYEIELDDFAKALPMKMDYILFDACLMGGVEVAYELKDKCGYVGFSQAEVLAEGFDYTTLVSHLLGPETPNPQAVCEDYFHQYEIQSGIYQSATISIVDCTKMEPLADICHEMFDKYKDAISRLNPNNTEIQRYFRGDYHWFYDLKDIIIKAGASEDEIHEVQEALDKCVVYKAATPKFMGSFRIETYSGLSMYLQSQGTSELDKYYRTLEWNKATLLVK